MSSVLGSIGSSFDIVAGAAILTERMPHCDECGATLAPNGACLEVGACTTADARAARASSSGRTAKFAVPAAWNVRGGVD